MLPNPVGGDPVAHDHMLCLQLLARFLNLPSFLSNKTLSEFNRKWAFMIGEGKRRKEFVEWYVAWRAEWHNYAKYDLHGE